MTDWQIEHVVLGIAVLALFIHLAAWIRLCDRVTRLEVLVKLLEKEIIVMHNVNTSENESELNNDEKTGDSTD